MRYLDLKLTLGSGILTKVDRASMAVSLEVRPVFLHREMLDLASAVPPRLLADRRETKKVLKRALRPWLPDAVLYRQKMGFAMPLGRWLRAGSPLLDTALQPDSRVSSLLDTTNMRQAASVHASGREDRTATLHSVVFLDQWLAAWS
jgi:asparagine synthase (glutamine-hydrolysing)